MYNDVFNQLLDLKDYVEDNICDLLSWSINRKLTNAVDHLTKAYYLIENGEIEFGLIHDFIAQTLVQISEFQIEIFNWIGFISDEDAEYLTDSVQKIRDNIIVLVGVSVNVSEAYIIALIAIEVFHLKDFIKQEINLLDRISLTILISCAIINLEIAILELSLNLDIQYTLDSAKNSIELAKDKVDLLFERGRISKEVEETIIHQCNQVLQSIDYILL